MPTASLSPLLLPAADCTATFNGGKGSEGGRVEVSSGEGAGEGGWVLAPRLMLVESVGAVEGVGVVAVAGNAWIIMGEETVRLQVMMRS
jgi:hypothetical protein